MNYLWNIAFIADSSYIRGLIAEFYVGVIFLNDQVNIQAKSALHEGISFVNINSLNHLSLLSRIKALLKFIGPAFIVSVAYIDPPIFVLEQ
jgi:hypothetical protein